MSKKKTVKTAPKVEEKVLEDITEESSTKEKVVAYVKANLKVNKERECIDFPTKVKDFMGKKINK